MSTIQSQSGPVDQYRRTRTPEVQLTGIQGSLETPGAAIEPPVSSGAQTAEQLLHAFSSLQGASLALVAHRNRQQYEADRRAAVEKQHQAELDAADRGNANQFIAANAAEILSKVESGEIRPEDGEDFPHFVRRVTFTGHEGQSLAFKEQLLTRLGDDIGRVAKARVENNVKIARAANAGFAIQSIDGATTPEQFEKAVSAVKKFKPDTPDDVIIAEVGARWLNNAVALARTNPEQGTKVLAAARAQLGDKLKTEQEIAQNQYDAAIDESRNKSFRQLQEQVGQMLDNNAPFPTVRAFIAEEGKRLGIDVHGLQRAVDTEHSVLHNRRDAERDEARRDAEDAAADEVAGKILAGDFAGANKAALRAKTGRRFALGLRDQVDAHEARALRESREAATVQAKAMHDREALAYGTSLAKAGQVNFIEDQEFALPDGTTHKVSKNELREAAMGAQFAAIAKQYKDDPDTARTMIVQEAARNAYFPAGWKTLIDTAGAKISTAAIATSKDGSLPPDAQKGYEFFKQLSAQAPGLRNEMSLNPRAVELFTTAMELEKDPLVGNSDPVLALKNAAAIVDDPRSFLDTVKLTAISNELDISTQSDLELAREAAPLARIYTRMGKTPEDAVKHAVKQVEANRLKINGWSSRMDGIPEALKYQFADVVEDKIAAYAETVKDAGIDKRDLAIRLNQSVNLWEIVMRETGLQLPGATSFATADLAREAQQRQESQAKQKYIERNRQLKERTPLDAYPSQGGGI